jgi:hypothetical protein
MVVVVLTLLAVFALQSAFVIMFFAEKRRSDRRYQAMLDYVHRYVEDVSSSLEEQIIEEKTDTITKVENALGKYSADMIQRMADVDKKCEALEMDYSQAQNAAKRINDFGSSLASIFDYDPIKAIQKGRTKEAS